MKGSFLIYVGSVLIFGWGLAHLLPTRKVVQGFGDISADNKRTMTMEWINEGATLMFIGILIMLVTHIDRTNTISHAVYWSAFAMLNTMSLISLFTGFKNSFIPFKLCPFIFSGSSLLIILGSCWH